ncbi:G patch domain-containing protein 4 [Leptodactylus fuscus]|uniref:G patch domain-containing protein 4 n=1 Tax=Leptodactylus fuscus TaxID=238119 RepID=UPI003F4E6E5F
MDAPSNIKSAGMKFAEQQMQRHGWTEGKGLGKNEDGMSEAIKVKVKCDSAGVGHNPAEQFTFHWWDHVFNKTASSISVESNQDGVTVKKLSEDDGPAVSSKKPRKAMLHSNMLYGRFIKSATLTSGGEKPVEEPSSSSDSSDSSEDEDSKLDLSSATKLSDKDLMKICGGRTAHKGARHGLTMSAKLSRIEEQERAFMEKYGKKETNPQTTKPSSEVPSVEEMKGNDGKVHKKKKQRQSNEEDDPSDGEIPKKKKKKHKKRDCEETVEDVPSGRDQDPAPSVEVDTKTSKKKKKSKVLENIEMAEEDHKNDSSVEGETTRPAKKKKKRKTVENEESMIVNGHTEAKEEQEDGNTEEEAGKKKKKKKRRTEDHEEMVITEETIAGPEEEQTGKPKNKRKWCEENGISTEDTENGRRRKNKQGDKEEEPNEEDDTNATKKKKKSKHKDRKD